MPRSKRVRSGYQQADLTTRQGRRSGVELHGQQSVVDG